MSNHFVNDAFLEEQGRVNRRVRSMPVAALTSGVLAQQGNDVPLPLVVVLNEELASAENSKVGSFARASICTWDDELGMFTEWRDREEDDGVFEPNDLQPYVWNHSEHGGHAVDTFGVAIWIGFPTGHYWFFADCGIMGERKAPIAEAIASGGNDGPPTT